MRGKNKPHLSKARVIHNTDLSKPQSYKSLGLSLPFEQRFDHGTGKEREDSLTIKRDEDGASILIYNNTDQKIYNKHVLAGSASSSIELSNQILSELAAQIYLWLDEKNVPSLNFKDFRVGNTRLTFTRYEKEHPETKAIASVMIWKPNYPVKYLLTKPEVERLWQLLNN